LLKRLIGLAALAAMFSLPAAIRAQGPASVCVDGTTSNATGSGACSGHGGVDKAKTKAAHTPPAPPPAAATMVSCKDGTQSKSGKGACSHHGGIGAPAAAATATAAPPAPPPAPPSAAAGPAVMCTDGTMSNTSGKGACSHHGGVKHNGATPPAPPAPAPAAAPAMAGNGDHPNNDPQGAIAKCKDGTYSHAKQHSGACSQHGGVGQWLDGTTKQ
jgi:hypothetical protein